MLATNLSPSFLQPRIKHPWISFNFLPRNCYSFRAHVKSAYHVPHTILGARHNIRQKPLPNLQSSNHNVNMVVSTSVITKTPQTTHSDDCGWQACRIQYIHLTDFYAV